MSQTTTVKQCIFSLKRHNEVKEAVEKIIGDQEKGEVLMQEIRRIMHFDVNTKHYDEKRKKYIYDYRARLKEQKLREADAIKNT